MLKSFVRKAYEFLDGKTGLKEFEQWIYKNDCESLLKPDDYSQLISFNYIRKDANYELCKILRNILQNLPPTQVYRDKHSIKGLCITNKGCYRLDSYNHDFCLTIGKTYDILTIDFGKDSSGNRFWEYTIINDESFVHLIPSEVLKVQLSQIPEGWVVEENQFGGVTIEPKQWNWRYYQGTNSFWEDFHDGEETAILEFVRVLHLMNIEVPDRYRPYAIKLLTE